MRLNRQAAKRWISFQTTLILFGLGLLCWFVPSAWGANLDFTRIKSQLVSIESHPLARQASQIYQKLLPAWDSHRSPPELYVADVNEEILALSLQDGGILLSTAAIKLCLNAGPNGNSFLAFVLAHELAHQKSNDLLHLQLMAFAGSQLSPGLDQMIPNQNLDHADKIEELEFKADSDGIVMMMLTGYDPMAILSDERFFRLWVNRKWSNLCDKNSYSSADICQQIKTRVLKTRSRIDEILSQTVLFTLGIQAFVLGDYPQARNLFNQFAHYFPSSAVHKNIGLSYLRDIAHHLVKSDQSILSVYQFPMILESDLKNLSLIPQQAAIRRSQPLNPNMVKILAENAVNAFNKAFDISSNDKEIPLYLSIAYLFADNLPMAQGVLLGQYVPKYGHDAYSDTVLAALAMKERKWEEARKILTARWQQLNHANKTGFMNERHLLIIIQENLSLLYLQLKQKSVATDMWKQTVDKARKNSDGFLFQYALRKTTGTNQTETYESFASPGLKVGQYIRDVKKNLYKLKHTPSFSLSKFELYYFDDALSMLIDDNKRIFGIWQEGKINQELTQLLKGTSEDRLLKTFGLPQRFLSTHQGYYFAYDQQRLAFYLEKGVITGWFQYPSFTSLRNI